MGPNIQIATAGWGMPRDVAELLPSRGSGLERYAGALGGVEINSSFHRSHRRTTYERWSAQVPAGFRFAVKLPRTVTHDAKLVGVEALIDAFLGEVAGLGEKRGPILVQTPPKLPFDHAAVEAVCARLRTGGGDAVAWEPRHASWFTPAADAWLAALRVARVAADPAPHPGGGEPGGWRGLTYRRLHGAPRIYYSAYDAEALTSLTGRLDADTAALRWCVFDNTASGAASRNALTLSAMLAAPADSRR